MTDHYAVLQLSRDASADEIQRAYRTLALRYHPDRNRAPDAAAKMMAVNEAYETLHDGSRRRQYDALLAQSTSNAELDAAILQAAREVILRSGWTVVEDSAESVALARGKQRLRVIFTLHLSNEVLRKLLRRYPSNIPNAVLALHIEGSIHADPSTVVIGLMNGERHGAPPNGVESGLFGPLLAAFL